MLQILFLILLLIGPSMAMALPFQNLSIEAETSAFSNFVWRGTTFSENKPVAQAFLDVENKYGLFIGTFVSNAKFSDEAMSAKATVTQETDVSLGKRWNLGDWEIQGSYNRMFFPGAGIFDTDEFNVQINRNNWAMELSYMDDYFGYHSTYKYARIGYQWDYNDTLNTALYLGYNSFNNPKGSLKSRCINNTCTERAFTTIGAGNPDYFDLYQVTSKTFDGIRIDLAFNMTNRSEYQASEERTSLMRAKDFAVITGLSLPFNL